MSDEIRWSGYTHQEVYAAVFTGPGHIASADAQGMWARVLPLMQAITDDLAAATGSVPRDWEGTAAEQAARNLSLLGSWVSSAVRTAAQTATALETQAQFVADLRNNMPPPPSGTPTGTWEEGSDSAGYNPVTLEDLNAQEAAQSEAAQRAVELMETYTSNSAQNKPHIYAFATPITVTADPAAVGGSGLGGVGGAGFASPAGPVAPLPASAAGPSPIPPGPGGLGLGGVGGVPVPFVSGAVAGAPTTGRGGASSVGDGRAAPAFRPSGTSEVPGGRRIPHAATGGIGPGEAGGAGSRGPGVGGAPTGASAAESTRTTRGLAGTHGFFPPGAGAAGGQGREHRRPSYLVDETDAFGDHRWFTEQVITPTDPLPRPG